MAAPTPPEPKRRPGAPGWLARLRDYSARLERRRSATSYFLFSAMFLTAALLWTRLYATASGVRHLWAALLLTLAVRDFALALRRISRDRGLPPWSWIVASVIYGVVGTGVALALAWTAR
jgi:hypothetical protein